MRGVAVTAVVAFHISPEYLPGGFLGVDLFFVISGFVVLGSVIRAASASSAPTGLGFLRRRIQRLGPAFVGLVFIGSLVTMVFVRLENQDETAITGIMALLSLANISAELLHAGYFAADASSNLFLHLWSLSVEEQFYLGVAALLALGLPFQRILRERHRLFRWSLGVTLASFLLAVLGSSNFPLPFGQSFLGFYSPLTRVWEFGLGVLAYLVSEKIERPPIFLGHVLTGGALLVMMGSFVLWAPSTAHPSWGTAPLVLSGFVLLAFCGPSTARWFILTNQFSRSVGNMSYSLYLWHWVIIVAVRESFGLNFASMSVAVGLSLVLAYGSWVMLEKRHGASK